MHTLCQSQSHNDTLYTSLCLPLSVFPPFHFCFICVSPSSLGCRFSLKQKRTLLCWDEPVCLYLIMCPSASALRRPYTCQQVGVGLAGWVLVRVADLFCIMQTLNAGSLVNLGSGRRVMFPARSIIYPLLSLWSASPLISS